MEAVLYRIARAVVEVGSDLGPCGVVDLWWRGGWVGGWVEEDEAV